MIIGTGQLAQAFYDFSNHECCIFASGVANSNCIDTSEFEREHQLLTNALMDNTSKKFVYFSSCALSAKEYELNDYYKHKIHMEETIKKYSDNYYIFRIPQLFGNMKKHSTLINFLYRKIKEKQKFTIYKGAYRYIIEINDVRTLVEKIIAEHPSGLTMDLANPYRYSILEIVQTIETLLHTNALYDTVNKHNSYLLNLEKLNQFLSVSHVDLDFGKDYLEEKLKRRLN